MDEEPEGRSADPPPAAAAAPPGLSRRLFLRAGSLAGGGVVARLGSPPAAGACALPITWAPRPSVDGWEHRTLMHFLNTVFPGDDGRELFPGDRYPLRSGDDASPGAFSACALDVLYDPFFGVAGLRARLLAILLDWAAQRRGIDGGFHRADQAEQLGIVEALGRAPFVGGGIAGAALLGLAAVLGGSANDAVTRLVGWEGPNGGHYGDARHPVGRWRQPASLTADGNLP